MATPAIRAPRGPLLPPGAAETSLGLTRANASALAYSAGWISGLLVLWLEERDGETRRHAAQATLGFGLLSGLAAGCLLVAAVGLAWSLTVFRAGLWAAQGVVAVALVLWLWSLVRVAMGGSPRWPLLGARAERLAGSV